MLKPTVKRNLMLDFIPDEIVCCPQIDSKRVYKLNNNGIKNGDVVYIMSRELRLEDNWALIFACNLAKSKNNDLKILVYLDKNTYSEMQKEFLLKGVDTLKENMLKNCINFDIIDEIGVAELQNAGAIVVDFNPINVKDDFYKSQTCAVFEVDSHNIIPARFISDKQEFSAATLRRKVYANLANFLTEFKNPYETKRSEALLKLDNFIQNKLDLYTEYKNNPNFDVTSHMSPYLHFGFISAQRIALEVLKSSTIRENKEAYLEELIVRKELSDNFCLYNENYKNFEGVSDWAKVTLLAHKNDIRTYTYDLNQFEYGQTHDKLWNVIQINLIKIGYIHGYLRMYWAKKILEWSTSPEEALEIAIYLNDKYALDGNDPNGYVGVHWSIGGLHDRPFFNRLVTGKIRYMSLSGCKKKFDLKEYLNSKED